MSYDHWKQTPPSEMGDGHRSTPREAIQRPVCRSCGRAEQGRPFPIAGMSFYCPQCFERGMAQQVEMEHLQRRVK